MKDLSNKIVAITGASSGIGEHLAYEFAKEKSILVLIARNKDKLEEVKTRCLENTPQCHIFCADLADTSAIMPLIDEVTKTVGNIDILINNAGMSQRSFAVETPLENDRTIMELNFFSKVALTKCILPSMIKNKSGHIVAISSVVGKFGFPMRTAYSSSKHAIQGFFESLRAEVKDHGITVTIVSPGRIKTNISKNALTKDGTSHGKMDKGQEEGMDATLCAKKIISAIKADKRELLVGGKELWLVYIRKYLPFLYHRIVNKIKN